MALRDPSLDNNNGVNWCTALTPYGDGDLGTPGAENDCVLPPTIIEVTVDIKPGSDPNSINLGSKGVIPVAILSDATFDATTVDPETVELAGASVAVGGKGSKLLAHVKDVNGDGLLDLVVKVETEHFNPNGGATSATLTATTFGGEDIEGTDSINIVPSG
jgi:hypothetical protein